MAEGKVMLKYQGLKGKARNLQQTTWDGCYREGKKNTRLSEKAHLGFRLVAKRQRCSKKKKEMLCFSE